MTEHFTGSHTGAASGEGSDAGHARYNSVVWRATREVYQRALEKSEAGEVPNFKEYRIRENRVTSEAGELEAEEIRRRYGPGNYIVERLKEGERTTKDLSFISIPARGEIVLEPEEELPFYFEQSAPRYPRHRNRSRRPRRAASPNDGLVREMIGRLEKSHAEERARMEQHNAELREAERRHQEEIRQLQEQVQAERFKRLEEKIEESGSRKNEEPSDFKSSLVALALKKMEAGDEAAADGLISMVRGDGEESGGSWAADLISEVRKDPQGALQFVQVAAQSIASIVRPTYVAPPVHHIPRGPQPAPAPVPAPQPQPQPAPAPTDEQVINGLLGHLVNGLTNNYEPKVYARLIRDAVRERPHLRALFEEQMQRDDGELLSMLSLAAGVPFEGLQHDPLEWMKDFRRSLRRIARIGTDIKAVPDENAAPAA